MFKILLKRMVISSIAIYFLFKNIPICLIGGVVFSLISLLDKKERKKSRTLTMQVCFFDFMICLEPLLRAAGTFPSAFKEAVLDYMRFHGEDEFSKYIRSAVNEFKINRPTTKVLLDLAQKIDIEDAHIFASSMAICEETGGNAIDVTQSTVDILVGKMKVQSDIQTGLSGRIFEQKVITMMPFLLLGLFSIVADAYLEPLYTSVAGRVVMAFAGAIFLLQWLIGKKIINIEV